MQKLIAWIFATFVFCSFFYNPGVARAGNKYHVFTVSPFVGARLFEGNQKVDDSATAGLAIGYNFSEVWSAEGVVGYTPTESSGTDIHLFNVHLDVLYHFRPYGPLVPYIVGGGGGYFVKREGGGSDDDIQINFGAGVKYFITDNIALRADIRPVLDINVGDGSHSPDTYWNLIGSAGLFFQLGSPRETRIVLDTDDDGVLDVVDECLETPPGAPVTRRGCSRDSDRDGVPDYRDLCPATSEGTVVTDAGCPALPRADRDNDGVEDAMDHCPDSLPGQQVNAIGCPLNK